MRLDNFVSLIGGELKNTPAISFVNNFKADVTLIQRGDLFFAKNKADIPQAIQKGAYAIVYEGWVQREDSEIAWIKVESLKKALKKLLRYLLVQKRVSLVALPPLSLELAHYVIGDKAILLEQDIFTLLDNFDEQKLLLCSQSFAKDLALEFKKAQKEPIQIIQTYLFETSFVFANQFFERLQIAPLFLQDLQYLLFCIKKYDLLFSFANLKNFPHFQPIFLDAHLEPTEFGKSERVLIFETDCALLQKEKKFLQQNARWAKQYHCTLTKRCRGFEQITIDELKKILYNGYRYTLCEAFVVEKLAKKRLENSLL